ncbi:3624_t:CDS:2, partial [Entrophospora sp. SA101]
YGSINVSQSNSTNATDALIKVQYNSLANDKIQITQETYGNSYAIKIVQVNSITMFGLSIPPRCIVANIDITLPLIMDPNTNETTFHTDDFDITFAENANKYNQSLTINNEDSKIQFNNLSAKSLVINSNAGYVNGTITGIENNFSVIADDADLNLSVGIADNAKSAMVDIVNDVANDKIQITQETYGNSYAIKIVQVNSITMFGLSIPPRCIVANIDITLPLIMDPNTNETTFHTDDFDITFAENANKYNQSLTINNEDSKIQFNNLSAKSLVINSNAGYVNGTITGIENNFSVIADDADLNLSVGIADNAKSAMVDIVNDVGIISTNYPQEVKISDNEHKANDINTSNNRFTNGSLTIKNISGKETVEEKDVLYNPSTTETMDNDGDDGSDCSKSKENKICAFHVHQPIWNEMCRGESLNNNHPELNTCPFFNFTFCVIFNTITEFPINIPAVPRCYCGKPIVLRRIIRRHNKGKWFMSCASYQIPGARPKCAWFEWANKVLYDKKDQSNISISEEEKDHDDKDVTRHFQEIKDIQINNHDDIDFFNT